jgi:hypothetical protein
MIVHVNGIQKKINVQKILIGKEPHLYVNVKTVKINNAKMIQQLYVI